jgi:hypothetical protein
MPPAKVKRRHIKPDGLLPVTPGLKKKEEDCDLLWKLQDNT